MMDIAGVTAVYNGLKSVKDIVSGLSELKIDTESLAKINEAVKKAGEAQDGLYQLREELFRLQEENNNLKSKIASTESWELKLDEYELVKTSGLAIVYRYKAEPEHFICPSCVEEKSIQILQNNRTDSGKYRCMKCEGEYPIEPRVKRKPYIPRPIT